MIRMAIEKDISKILDLLSQVDLVHYKGRSDILKIGTKYNEKELKEILKDKNRPILVAVNEKDDVTGYCFCIFEIHEESSVLRDIKTLYIDDLCVDENCRRQHIGKELFQAAKKFAKDNGCYNLTLNVWSCNPSALEFYKSLGMNEQKMYGACAVTKNLIHRMRFLIYHFLYSLMNFACISNAYNNISYT